MQADATTADATLEDTAGGDTGAGDTAKSDTAAADTAPLDTATGPCVGKKDDVACDDGDPCTQASCQKSVCTAETDLCECRTTADCAGKQARLDRVAKQCAPELYCDKASAPYKCAENPGSIIVCPTLGDTACNTNQCQPATGKCAFQGVDKGTSCDDGDACTGGDACDGAGQCAAGATELCECQVDGDCAPKDDGNPCNGTLYCDKTTSTFTCKLNPATVVKCPDVDWLPCKVSACAPVSGLCTIADAPENSACSDGQPCTTGDVCQKGACAPGTNTCACQTDADCAKHDDGDLCNGVHFCDKQTGTCRHNPATVVSCPSVDDTACVRNLCSAKTGKCGAVAVNNKGACDDDDPCTSGDACQQGLCRAGVFTCPCAVDADCANKEDGDLCNGTLICVVASDGKRCLLNPATKVVCPTVNDTACARNRCAPKTGVCGVVSIPDGATCDADGNACTEVDTCKAGACVADDNSCECQQTADCAKLDDGDPCNGALYCDKTTSKPTCRVNPATLYVCKTAGDTGCTRNACQAKDGACKPTALSDNSACDDGNPCTKADMCFGGACVAGLNVCACKVAADCAAGDDGDACTGTLTCSAGVCAPTVGTTCEQPADPCSVAFCDPDDGACKTANRPDGEPCSVAKGSPKACKSGICMALTAAPQTCVTWSSQTVAGNANAGKKDDKGAAAQFTYPCGLALDAQGNAYTASRHSDLVRRVATDGTVTTFAGGGSGSKDGVGKQAGFLEPCGVAFDGSGNLFVSERNGMRIRRITAAAVVTTVVGQESGFKDGQGASGALYYPMGIAFDAAGLMYVADELNHAIRRVDPSAAYLLTTVAGAGPGKSGSADGKGAQARFNAPMDVAVLGAGLVVADSKNHRVRAVSQAGVVTTLAGSKTGYADGATAAFNTPEFVAAGADGDVWVADTQNHRIRRIAPTGHVTTIAGAPLKPASGVAYGFSDGVGTSIRVNAPRGIMELQPGKLFFADSDNHRVRTLTCVKWTSSLCGNGQLDAGEACDDGNADDGDACDNACKTNP